MSGDGHDHDYLDGESDFYEGEECDTCDMSETRELELNEECWMEVLMRLGPRELCMVARVNRYACGTHTHTHTHTHTAL